ncbi:hypothetical protein FOT62_22675 [Serratia marcescens]|uniref:Uncharacterized protein n=1 Tax=Serratia marcescens TaxID=615 RepID=A0A5C7BUZ1_SERMA|nr:MULTISPECIES: hypothetical protein [Serratia]TXE27127.1 hypothetical protein FOT62_22675 [Serratia marcescens]TXE55316.1 hypothetical protein FOT56_25490 [Serratia marcescens]
MNTFKADVETITPEIAITYLGANTINRNLNQTYVDRYVREMKSGTWRLNAESIKFDASGRLIDGQHRLNAVVMAGVAIQSLVVRGIPVGVIDTLDTGKARTGGDVLAISGITEKSASGCIAQAVCTLLRYEAGVNWSVSGGGYKYLETNEKIAIYYRGHMNELKANLLWIKENLPSKGGLMPASDVLALLTICARKDPTLAHAFFTEIFKGINLADGSMSWALRNRLIHYKTGTVKANKAILKCTFLLCWNRLRAGKSVKAGNIMYRQGESVPFAK